MYMHVPMYQGIFQNLCTRLKIHKSGLFATRGPRFYMTSRIFGKKKLQDKNSRDIIHTSFKRMLFRYPCKFVIFSYELILKKKYRAEKY